MSKTESKTAFITDSIDMSEYGSAAQKMPPTLVLLAGADQHIGRHWVLDRDKTTLGRMAPADIQIEAASLSKMHAHFNLVEGEVSITDLGSTNKTFINDEPLEPHKSYRIKNNDRIRAGKLLFKFLQRGILSETSEKSRMELELVTARSVQSTIFPTKTEVQYGSVKIGGRYRTATECGGDWWWHWSAGDRAFALIADATGHGAGAAMLTSAARSAIAGLEDDPATTLEKVYQTLTRALFRVANGAITMSSIIVEVDFKLGQLRYINASHPFPVLLPKPLPENTNWRKLDYMTGGNSRALGSMPEEFNIAKMPLKPQTRLVLLTDGLIERTGAGRNPLPERAFFGALMEAHRLNLEDQSSFLDNLLANSDALAYSAAQQDDITVVVLDFN